MQLVAFVAFEKEQQKNAQGEHEESTDKVPRQQPHETQLQKNSEAASTLLTILVVSLLGAGLHASSRTLSLQLPVEKTQPGSHLAIGPALREMPPFARMHERQR